MTKIKPVVEGDEWPKRISHWDNYGEGIGNFQVTITGGPGVKCEISLEQQMVDMSQMSWSEACIETLKRILGEIAEVLGEFWEEKRADEIIARSIKVVIKFLQE